MLTEDVTETTKPDDFWILNLTSSVTAIPTFRDTLERAKRNYATIAHQYCDVSVKIRKLMSRQL